ncbi:MAG: hypothetical protein ACRD2A_00375 [Vicinamibacterales bacterium]
MACRTEDGSVGCLARPGGEAAYDANDSRPAVSLSPEHPQANSSMTFTPILAVPAAVAFWEVGSDALAEAIGAPLARGIERGLGGS